MPMNLESLKVRFAEVMKSLRGENDLYDFTDGQFMYFEKHRTIGRPLSNKEIRMKKNINKMSPVTENKYS